MRIKPLAPDMLNAEVRYVHDEIAKLIGHSQGQVNMVNAEGALLGPFPPMLHYPQFRDTGLDLSAIIGQSCNAS